MRKRLPPLFSLQVFEAAARHGKFSRAAEELNLTQGAVSRQIKQLEAWTALPLFERNGPRVDLTRAGHDLLARLGAPLNALHAAVYGDIGAPIQTLHVATLVSIARAVLLPQMPAFLVAHPHVDITIQTDYALVSLPPRLPMVALRFGSTPVADMHADLLFGDRMVSVAAPAVAARVGADPRHWPMRSLLRHTTQDWSQWLQAAGLEGALVPAGMEFNDAGVLLDAAEAGAGIALARLSVAWSALLEGRLVQVSPVAVVANRSHYLVCRAEVLRLPAVLAFREWVLEQAKTWRRRLEAFDAEGQVVADSRDSGTPIPE